MCLRISRCSFNVAVSRQYARNGCGCGAASSSEALRGLLLTALAMLGSRSLAKSNA